MTRKHPNRRMLIPLNAQEREALRVLARGGSLGDALRRLVQVGLTEGVVDLGAVRERAAPSRLPLQLPRQARRMVERLAQREGSTPELVVWALLRQALARARLER
ncbi:hypothetical protein TRM7557_01802 [Tritonibacter multivorans]|uniref:Uncharacterized protein n=1 Tax=Tritonibacter multivorans TaxID=928856 RepID=A0A0P1GRZ7_9RHOB|nr:hypothetical protein [Tritonibacter multivorans]MDA7422858.1 hypothetical protein [Tritonibacter multivorans]CUH78271.1 hypothetical protein TRM7557_01802 [Tritonibacter multivorans]SFD62180.1 hypothetical protein SAMN04488049_11832 [Tritonibacter multivorans]